MANRDPEATKARILDAAVREFSEKGIAGARVDAIAAGAARQQADALLLLRLEGRALPRDPPPPAGRALGDDPRRSCPTPTASPSGPRASAADPEYTRLIVWEALELDPEHPVNEELRRDFYADWVGAVEEEQRAGRLPADLDAAQLVLSEICLTMGPFLLPQVTRLVTGLSALDPEFLTRRERVPPCARPSAAPGPPLTRVNTRPCDTGTTRAWRNRQTRQV